MGELMRADDVRALLEPAIASMLSDREQRSLMTLLEYRVRGGQGAELLPDDLVESGAVWVRWRIRGEWGGSTTLSLEDGPEEMVALVLSDLQDFIAESRFGWGERRFPRTASPRDSA